jgi:hypothetical protein
MAYSTITAASEVLTAIRNFRFDGSFKRLLNRLNWQSKDVGQE